MAHKGAMHGSTLWFHSLSLNAGDTSAFCFLPAAAPDRCSQRQEIRDFQQLSLSLKIFLFGTDSIIALSLVL